MGDGGAVQFSRKMVVEVDVDLRESPGVCVNLCNRCTCSGNSTQEWAVQDLLCLVDLYLVYLI